MLIQGYRELTLEMLNRSPEVGNLLVQLHDKHRLYTLAKNSHPESRAELAGIMADLLRIQLTPTEGELITDVLMSLMRQAGDNLKRAVAERLSTVEGVPLRLVVHLANEKILIARPILERSRVLDDRDLSYIIQSQTKNHWQAIAKRAQLSKGLIDMLVDKKDLRTAINLSENKNIVLTGHAVVVLADMAKNFENLAKPLLAREELSSELASELYNHVGRELKDYIKQNFEIDHSLVDEIVDDIVFEFSDTHNKYAPKADLISAAENMWKRGFLNPHVMVENLRRGQISNFVAMFSVYCELSVDTVIEMIHQNNAQGLAIACKATGIQKPEFVNMFLLTSSVRGGKVIEQENLVRALAYFDRVNKKVAKRILGQDHY